MSEAQRLLTRHADAGFCSLVFGGTCSFGREEETAAPEEAEREALVLVVAEGVMRLFPSRH